MPALFMACTDLSPLRTYFYKIVIFLFLQASKPPSPQASKPQYASAGDAKRKQFHVLRTDRRAGVGLHSVVAEESCYSMLIRIWFDVVAIKVAKST